MKEEDLEIGQIYELNTRKEHITGAYCSLEDAEKWRQHTIFRYEGKEGARFLFRVLLSDVQPFHKNYYRRVIGEVVSVQLHSYTMLNLKKITFLQE